ncbi:MAG: hypothetical protein WAO58_12585 [Fimbriimonadaceae bacterium]
MRYLLCIQLSGFYCQAQRGKAEENRYLVIHRDKAVLCANEPSVGRGIEPGMPLSEAKAILREGVFLAWEEDDYRDAQESWLDVCAEFANAIEPEDQHIAFIDLTGHPDPADIALRLARAIKHRFGYGLNLGMGSTKWIAKLARSALTGQTWEQEMILREPVLDPAGFISSFPVSQLLPVAPEHRKRLHFLGYRTIGEVTALSLSTLKGHFAEDGLRIYQAAWGGCFEPVQAIYPRDAIQERVSFDGTASSREVIDRGLKALAGNLARRLIEKDMHGSEMRVWIEFEVSEPVYQSRTFTRPMHSARSILAALNLLAAERVSEEMIGIRVQLANLSQSKQRQSGLYGEVAARAIAAQTAISRVRGVFGDAVVQLGCEVKEPRRKQLIRVWKDATGWR